MITHVNIKHVGEYDEVYEKMPGIKRVNLNSAGDSSCWKSLWTGLLVVPTSKVHYISIPISYYVTMTLGCCYFHEFQGLTTPYQKASCNLQCLIPWAIRINKLKSKRPFIRLSFYLISILYSDLRRMHDELILDMRLNKNYLGQCLMKQIYHFPVSLKISRCSFVLVYWEL